MAQRYEEDVYEEEEYTENGESYDDGYEEHNESVAEEAPPAAPARPPHPLFGNAGAKNELLKSAQRMNQERSDATGAPPGASARAAPAAAATSFRPPTNDAAPRPPAGGNPMADQVAMLAQKRSERMSNQGDAAMVPPPARQPQESKPPVFSSAKLRKTPSATNREIEQQQQSSTNQPYAQNKLRASEGVHTRAPPQQDLYDQKEEEPYIPPAPVPIENNGVFQEGADEYYPENPQYERVLLSRQEPEVVTQHKVISSEPEYEIIEYKICCTIL